MDCLEQPYGELFRAVDDGRAPMPGYGVLRRELRELETVGRTARPTTRGTGPRTWPTRARASWATWPPNGHTVLDDDNRVYDRSDLEREIGLQLPGGVTVEEDHDVSFDLEPGVPSFNID